MDDSITTPESNSLDLRARHLSNSIATDEDLSLNLWPHLEFWIICLSGRAPRA